MSSTVQKDRKNDFVKVHELEQSNTEISSSATPLSPRASFSKQSQIHLPPIVNNEAEKKLDPPKQEIKLLCMKCEEDVSMRKLKSHRDFHQALQTFRYTMEAKPSTVKHLVKRRRALMKKLNEPANFENPVSIKKLHKLNIAYELLKADIEGTKTNSREIEEYSQLNIHGHGTTLSSALAFGVCEDGNSRWRTTMEDRYAFQDFFCNDPQSGFFAIYDGYNGATAAEKCAQYLHEILAEKVETVYRAGLTHEQVNSQIITAFMETYGEMDKRLLFGVNESSRNRWSGCSAVTCLLRGNNLYVANAGNVRAVLCKGDGSFVRLSQDHSPWNKRERHRVKKAGEVTKSEKTALVNGLVASTRGLGNHGDPHLKLTVISQPVVKCVPLEDSDQFVILASNGVWETFSEEEVILLLDDIMPEIDVKAVVRRMQKSAAQETKTELLNHEHSGSGSSDVTEVSNTMHNEPNGKITRNQESYDADNLSFVDASENLIGSKGSNMQTQSSIRHSLGPKMRKEEKAIALAKALSERLVESSLLAGSKDNVTVAVVLLKGCPLQMFLLPSIFM